MSRFFPLFGFLCTCVDFFPNHFSSSLIAAMRRILVITAEAAGEVDDRQFDRAMLELGLLTLMTLILVVSIILLRRSREPASEQQA